ncbi:MAG: UDP-N-acetylmuramate--L-alanine ligase [Oscillospiraceae bacterium]|nr:UDP-N-acetylmuramate--L-alanine ligase [Oscillospiraceae bacterium]
MNSESIRALFAPGSKAHLVGIGGVSMAPLAEVLYGLGMKVTGSDFKESATVQHLRQLGIPVVIGHFAESVTGTEMVIRTAAVHDDNPEIAAARAQGIPVVERAEAWGALMMDYQNALCISGTHGKTTTTSMCTHIAMAAQIDPTVMIGGTLPLLHAGHRVGQGDTIILESCEYCDSFLSFHPTIAVILDIEADHLDYFKDLEDVEKSFRRFAELVPDSTGVVVANADDENTMRTLAGLNKHMVTFGAESPADITSRNVEYVNGLPSFDIYYHEDFFAHVELQVPGLHNVKNALAAAASAILLGLPAQAVTDGLGGFHGAGRRFEHKGSYHGAEIYDDYAHHPGEIKALLDAVEKLGYQRVILAFQPHTYSRTKALFDDFVEQLKRPDITLLAEIYAAREKNTLNIHSRDLADRIPGATAYDTLPQVTERLKELAQPGDLILTVGAGDIYTSGEALANCGD